MKVKIEAIIDINDWVIDDNNKHELKWLIDIMNDKNNTHVVLWSNDIGDEIGTSSDFKYELIK